MSWQIFLKYREFRATMEMLKLPTVFSLYVAANCGQASPSDTCVAAAQSAAAITDVPLSVLVAITQTETGRSQHGQTQPWPWTVNMEGEGQWFDTRDEALTFVFEQYNAGARSFDIGCFQINFRWHGENFNSIEEMFDPVANATYAAKFLSDLHAETGDWSAAAGAFHSRTEEKAARYRDTFDQFRNVALDEGFDSMGFSSGADPILIASASKPEVTRNNTFPLLQALNGSRSPGSLVPLSP